MKIEKNKVENVSVSYKLFSNDSHMIVSEWMNGEGYDICVQNELGTNTIQLHYSDIDALNLCIASLNLKLIE